MRFRFALDGCRGNEKGFALVFVQLTNPLRLAGYFEVSEWGQCLRSSFLVRQGPLYRDRLGDLAFLQDGVRVVRGKGGAIPRARPDPLQALEGKAT